MQEKMTTTTATNERYDQPICKMPNKGLLLDCVKQIARCIRSCYATLITYDDNVVRVLRLQPMKVRNQNKPVQK